MKILLLAHRLPWPLHDGYTLRLHHYVEQLRHEHEFHLVALGAGGDPGVEAFPPDRREQYGSVVTVAERDPPRTSGLKRLTSPFDVSQMFDRDPAVVSAIERVSADHGPFDVVWIAGVKMLGYAQALEGVPLFADLVDEALAESLRELLRVRGPVSLLRGLKNVVNTYRFQRQVLAPAAVVNVVSEADKRWLSRNASSLDVRVVPNGVDAEGFAPQGGPERPASLVFEGSMDFAPNSEGVITFCRDTLPLIQAARPEVTFTIVGRDPIPEVAALSGPGVVVTGFVDDVRPYLDSASLFVCPLRRGAGIKNKILQAWAMEKAIVATPVSCGGLAIEDGVNLVVAETPQQIADAVLALLDDDEKRAALGRAGRQTVLRHSSWAASAAAIDGLLRETQGQPRGRPVA